MKQIFLLLVFSGLVLFSKAQFPSFPYSGNYSTGYGQNGAIGTKTGFVYTASFADTTAANAYQVSGSIVGFLKNIAGMVIRAGNDLWMRSSDLQYWMRVNLVQLDATVDFSVNANPNTVGTTFSPNTPQLTTVVYVSTIDGSQWTWNGSAYVLYVAPYWAKTGNAGTNTTNNFIGTTDNVDLRFRIWNLNAGRINATGAVGFGFLALQNNTSGSNVALGYRALQTNTSAGSNVAIGFDALQLNTGTGNTAVGRQVLGSNTTAPNNTGIGREALLNNTIGRENTAVGYASLRAMVDGQRNTAIGYNAMLISTTGNDNTAIGNGALSSTTGRQNLGLGRQAGYWNTTGNNQLFINDTARANFFADTTQSLVYGVMGVDSSVQRFKINGRLEVPDGTQAAGYVMTSDAAGAGSWQPNSGGSMVYPGAGIPLSDGSAWLTSITNNSTNWNTAYSQTRQWDGGTTGLTAGTGRASLGGTTVGQNYFTLTNPSAITFPRMNADNTITARTAAEMVTDLGVGATFSNPGTGDTLLTNPATDEFLIKSLVEGTNITLTTTDTTITISSSGGGTPGGSNTQVQYNNSSAFGGISGATTNGTKLTLINPAANNIDGAYTTTATAAGTTTLTVASTWSQFFTGTTTQTCVLPDATTLVVGMAYEITNSSTGIVTLNANGGSLIKSILPGQIVTVQVTSIGTAAGVWSVSSSITDWDWMRLSSTYTLTSTTASQKLFNVGASNTGEYSAIAGTTYEFEVQFSLSSMSATSGNAKFDILGAGTATVTSAAFSATGVDNTTPGTTATSSASYTATTISSGNIVAANTGTGMFATIYGTITINAAGTIIPSVALTTAAAAVVGVNSTFKIRKVAPGTVVYSGAFN